MHTTLNSKSLKLLIQQQKSNDTKILESQRPEGRQSGKMFRIRAQDSTSKRQELTLKKSPLKQTISLQVMNMYYQRSTIKPQAPNIFQKPTQNFNAISNTRQISRSQHIPAQGLSAPPSPKSIQKKLTNLHISTSKLFNDVSSVQVVKSEFKFIYVIGKGGFGKVWKVEHNKTKKLYAMKEMSKAKVISKRSVNSVLNERQLLKHLRHPFLVNMHFAFSDRENLYLAMDLLQGGDLRFHLSKMKRFSETQTKFFVACILLPLIYLHRKGIIHRDLKPENLVLDEQGYMRLTDLGVARIDKGQNQHDTSGTPGYMAPEVMCRQEHSIQVDYYALGVITHELMLGRVFINFEVKRPYNGRQRQEIREQILARQAQVKPEDVPIGWTSEAVDFVNKLIQRKPAQRLGATGPDEVMSHPWIKGFPFEKLMNRQMQGSYVPGQVDGRHDFQSYISEETVLNEEQQAENRMLLRRNTVQQLFEGYHYLQQQPLLDSLKKTVVSSTPNSPKRVSNSTNFE